MPNFFWKRLASFMCFAAMVAGASHSAFADNREDRVSTAAAYVKHVFVIVLENKNFSDTFGTSTQDPYLQKTLVPMGGLMTQYYGTGHVSLDNYISLISGQAPTQDTDNDCLPGFTGTIGNYNDVKQTGVARQGQVAASGGCIYARDVPTLPKQLEEAGLTWRGYMGDMGNDPTRESAACGHPTIGVGTDNTNSAEAPSAAVPLGDAYATRHDPFMYFHSIIDDKASCAKHVVNLNHLTADLAEERSTPNLIFITPNLCDDGHDGSGTGAPGTTCANGQPGGLTSADAFLKTWVPKIMDSAAYKKDGLLIITFDESSYTQSVSTSSSGQTTVDITFPGQTCCNQQPGPNLSGVRPGSFTLVSTPTLVENIVINGFGGDRIGALLLSPFVKPGSTSDTAYNHYSLLKSLEDIFHLDRIGYAADDWRAHYSLDTIGDDEDVFYSGPGRGHGHDHGHDFDGWNDPHFKQPWY
ncbi:alkaline phosphatase family protein [Acidobacterium sp. S8]|uniref:alkaline phosphatase family protein n=1 Tax=Acidobacterium sp. S8 TaxID=1641854 RepID=UPI0020B1542E|nr:alkaline phosphatase family protein [Acidobacterium sp. S8]